jgi:hypothetical protein
MSTNSGPQKVLIVRHGEKVGDPADDKSGSPDLSVQGSARAVALPSLFLPPQSQDSCAIEPDGTGFAGTYAANSAGGNAPRFATPAFIFATQMSKHSNRPVETITPTAIALQLPINSKHGDDDFAIVANDILTNAKYAGQTVLVCWHHGKIPELAASLGVSDPPKWPGTVFDRVWQITFDGGAATLANLPQQLLFGDSAS